MWRFSVVAALLASLAAFAVYFLTAARTVTWMHSGADSGELVAAAVLGGIPHPPGYPLYMVLAMGFARLPIGEPAFGVALLSALAGAGAIFVLARAGDALIRPTNRAAALVPPLAALGFAFAPLVWSQSIIPEVYALNLIFVAVILWACVSDHRWRVYIAALAFGLGMAHHLSILLLAPGALIALAPRRRDWRALLFLLAPLLFYLYLPTAAQGNPAVKWSDPTTIEGFLWIVTARIYQPYLLGVEANALVAQLAFSARSLLDQFTIVGLVVLVWGLVQLFMQRSRLGVALLLMFVPIVLYALLYASRDSYLYLLPAFAIALLWLVFGANAILQLAGDDRLLRGALVALVAALPIFQLVTHYNAMDASRDRAAFEYARQQFTGLAEDAVLFAEGDKELFSVWYYRHAIPHAATRSVIVSQSLLFFDWYYDSLRRTMSEVQFQPPDQVTDTHSRARELIRVTFAEGRQVCFTDSSPLLPDFEYTEFGVLECVVAEK